MTAAAQKLVRFDQVSKRYGKQSALDEVSFELAAGEMAFLTGHSGAGKSTLLKLLAVMERPTRGQVLMDNINLGGVRRRGIPHVRRRLGVIFQDHRLLMDRNVFENVALPLLIAGLPQGEIGKRVRACLEAVGLLDRADSSPATLSAGEQQRVGIARAVVGQPRLLLADEPTGNLDPELSWGIMKLFARFNEAGMSLIVASHDLHLVRQLKKRVLVLDGGRLVDDFQPEATPA